MRNPIKPATARSYSCYLNKWLIPALGDVPVAEVTNKKVKDLNHSLHAADLSPKTKLEILNLVKLVVASLVDDDGEPLFPRKWNHAFLDVKPVRMQAAKAFTAEQIERVLEMAEGRYRVLYALLAGTGLRIGEALAIRIERSEDCSYILPDCRTVHVRRSVFGTKEQQPKTKNAVRDVDIPGALARLLKDFIGDRTGGYLFCSGSGGVLLQGNILRDSLHQILWGPKGVIGRKHIPGYGFHSFRHFRETHLELAMLPQNLIDLWTGHSIRKHISGIYFKPETNIEKRKELCEQAGLGFSLPDVKGGHRFPIAGGKAHSGAA
jgi:integrase